MAKRKEYQIDGLAKLLSDSSLDVKKKESLFTNWCVNDAGMQVSESGEIDKKELAYLWKDLNKQIAKACGENATKASSLKFYMDSYQKNFLEDKSISELSDEKRKEIFKFFSKRKTSYVGNEDVESEMKSVDDDFNEANAIAKTRVTSIKGIGISNFISKIDLYNEKSNEKNNFNHVRKDLVTDGVGVYQNMITLQEEYNKYVVENGQVEEIEKFYEKYGGLVENEDGNREWVHGGSLAESMSYQVEINHRITNTEVGKLLRLIRKEKTGEGPDLPPERPEKPEDPEKPEIDFGQEYPIPKRGFFARLGRWMGRHPFLTGLIGVGAFVVTGGLINPVFMLSNIGVMILACGGGLGTVAAGGGIARAASPKYRNFIYNYDIEKYFKKIKKNNIKVEATLDAVKDIVGEKSFQEIQEVKTQTINSETNKVKAQKIEELVDNGKVNAETITQVKAIIDARKKKVNKALDNSKKLNKIQNLITKKQINAVDLGESDVKDAVTTERQAVKYEQFKHQLNDSDYTTALHIARYKKNAEESTKTKDDEPLVK